MRRSFLQALVIFVFLLLSVVFIALSIRRGRAGEQEDNSKPSPPAQHEKP